MTKNPNKQGISIITKDSTYLTNKDIGFQVQVLPILSQK